MLPGFISERPLGYVQLTSLGTSQGLTIPNGCSLILVSPTNQSVRWRDDGVDPTATIGQPLAAGFELRYTATGMTRLRFIEQSAGAILNVTFYGQGG